MHLVSVDKVAASVDGRTLFSDVSFGVTSEDRVGVVGPNGSGKTTLLRIVAGERAPDGGRVVPRRGLRVGWLPQDPALPDSPAVEVVAAADPTVEPHEAERLLAHLGIDPGHRVGAMSGGQRRRVSLARTLLPPSDLLVLDEPTNHLDVDTVDWLEGELQRRTGGLLVVTHDRYVLERVANRMLDLDVPDPGRPAEGRRVRWHDGSYSSLLEARAQRASQRERLTLRSRNLLRKEVAWLRRGPKARTSKPRFRLEQVEVLRSAAAGDPEARPLELGTGRTRLGNDVLDLEAVRVVRGGLAVLDGVDASIGPGERVAVVGPNGAGKTTLLHVLAGRLAPDSGQVRRGVTVQLGLYEQESIVAPSDTTVLDTLLAVAAHIPLANGETLPAHRLAERFGFEVAGQRTPVALLSGGERRRLALLHVLLAAPNVLLLDEPTNDLDLDTLSLLEDHLDGFGGTLVVASHDRFLLDRLTDRTLAVRGGTVNEHLDVAAARAAHRPSVPTGSGTSRITGPSADRARSASDRQADRRRARSLEARVDRLTARREELSQAMAAAATDHARLLELQAELRAVDAELSEAEDQWLALTVD